MLMEEAGKLKIYYADESGFSLEPSIPYGWQPSGEYVRITPVGGNRLNVFGLLSRHNDLHAFSTQGTIDTKTVIACMDEFVKTITSKTLVVLDTPLRSAHVMPPFTKVKSLTQNWGSGTKRDC
jgi:hypothetical protein